MKNNISFEYAFSKLEEIVKRLEQGTETLDISAKLYKEGIELSECCRERLRCAEDSIKSHREENLYGDKV